MPDSLPTITVSPTLIRLDLEKDGNQAIIQYENNSDQTVELDFSAHDFKSLEDRGQIQFLTEKNSENYQYSLSSWIAFSQTHLILNPHEQNQITISINKEKLTSGGHYASVLATITQNQSNNQSNISISSGISTLIFVRNQNVETREEAKVSDFVPISDSNQFPYQFVFRFHNSGNVDLVPYGQVTIKNVFGQRVAAGILNESSLITLPESIRTYQVALHKRVAINIPSLYTATLDGHYGNSNRTFSTQNTFFSFGDINPKVFIIMIIILVVLRTKLKRRN